MVCSALASMLAARPLNTLPTFDVTAWLRLLVLLRRADLLQDRPQGAVYAEGKALFVIPKPQPTA